MLLGVRTPTDTYYFSLTHIYGFKITNRHYLESSKNIP